MKRKTGIKNARRVLPKYTMVRVPGIAVCRECKTTFDTDVLREVEDYVPGECPRCGGDLRAKRERKYQRTWF